MKNKKKSKRVKKGVEMSQKTTRTSSERPVLTVKETAEFLGVSTSLIWSEIRRGKLQPLRLGDRILFSREYLLRFVNSDVGPRDDNDLL